MLTSIRVSSSDTLSAGALILAQPQLAAQVHARIDMATVLDLLYGSPDTSHSHASAYTPPTQPHAWA